MNTTQLNEAISKTLAAWGIPGGAVVVAQDDETFAQGYGVLEAGKPEAVNADTVFAIGSTTKAFTSALIGMLVDEGKLNWDDPVIKHIPDFQLYDDWGTKNVTVRDLLCHRLGLERAQKLYYHRGYDQREIMRRMRYLRPTSNFRTQFQYANQQYGVAGLLVEAVTGKSWDDFITERIFNALNMSRSFSGYDRITDHKNFAAPHAVLDETYPASVRFLGDQQPTDQFKIVHEPAGSIHTTANDLAQWLKALLNNGAPVLQPSTFNELTTPQIVMQDVLNSELAPLAYLQPATHFWTYSLGWWAMDYRGEKVLMHGGQMPGYNSAVAFFPQRKLALAVMVNVHQTLAHAALFYAISDILLDKNDRDWSTEFQMVAQGYMAQVKGQVDEMRLARDPNLPPSIGLDSFAGTFSNDLFGEMTVTRKDDSLQLTYGANTAILEHWQGDTFLAHWNLKAFIDDSMIAFSPDGKTMTLLNDRAEYKKHNVIARAMLFARSNLLMNVGIASSVRARALLAMTEKSMNPTELILKNFEKISSIPRGTKYEAGIRNWLIQWAAEHNCTSKTDAAGNLVIYVPASTGYENRPTLILQGHMDMVWQKTNESTHDFEHDPIQLIRDGDWIRANGTTLGADNGIGIALMMSIVEDESVKHPPLELLLTVEEEMGVVGADNLDPSLLSGKTLINVDSETEGVFTVGCAGGGSVNITLPVSWEMQNQNEVAFELKVSGLQGGHSGEDINKFRTNANKLIARLLDEIQRNVPLRLSTLKGGTARNAIPRDAEAVFVCAKDKAEFCKEVFSALQVTVQNELAKTEAGLVLSLNEIKSEPIRAIRSDETQAAIRLLMALPHGVSSMSADMPAFVETSNNIGVMELKEDGLSIVSNHRSSVFSRLEEITRRVETVAWLAGAKTEKTKMFPPWQPNMESSLLKKCVETYRSIKEEDPKVELTHGGLECGIISDRCGGLDTISMGPTIKDLHSPDERLFIPSLVNTWEFLKKLLTVNFIIS